MNTYEHQGYPESPRERAFWHLSRAAQTEGVTEGGMWRTAVVESAAAIVVALLDVADSLEYIGRVVQDKD